MTEIEQVPAPTADLPDDFTSAWATVLTILVQRIPLPCFWGFPKSTSSLATISDQ